MTDRQLGSLHPGRSLLPTLLALGLLVALPAAPAAAAEPGAADRPEHGAGAADLPADAAEPADAEAGGGAENGDPTARLAKRYRDWLEAAAAFITAAERAAFLSLSRDYQRDAFIERFWRERDPYPETARNELYERFDERVETIRSLYGTFEDDRARILLVHGPPTSKAEVRCTTTLIPAEIWAYVRSERVDFQFLLIFVKATWDGPATVYRPSQPFAQSAMMEKAKQCLHGDTLRQALNYIGRQGYEYEAMLERVLAKPRPRSEEWLATFAAFSTEVPADAPRLVADLAVDYPGRHDSRTVVQAMLTVPSAGAAVGEFAGYRSADFLLVGEVLAGDRLFESFRYKFGFPAHELPEEGIPLAFQRFLRPGDYTLIVRLEDLNSRHLFRAERALTVPKVDELLPPPPPTDSETARIFAEATAAIASGETTVKIVPPAGELLTGRVRFDTLAVGDDIDHVAFYLDGRYAMTKNRPPYNVELDLGEFPKLHTLKVEAFAADGRQLAGDERLLNAGGNRFAVRLTSPERGKSYRASLQARAEVEVPEGRKVDRVEFFLNERRVATLYQPPFVQPIALPPGEEITYVRATAYLPDGNSTEDLVYVNAPPFLEELDVQFVELYTTATDERGRPVEGLGRGDFRILEDGVPQTVNRFELVRDLPIHAAILIDNSGSMRGSLGEVRRAALSFFQQAITPKDRAAVITFNKFPHLAVKLTNRLQELGGGLAGLTAEGNTALYDSVIFSLYYLAGIRGQRTLLVLSDGKDESSQFSFEQALEYARRAGVTVYTIGLGLTSGDARRKLARLADETGGRSYFVGDPGRLEDIYHAIQEELRSQYLIAYQSTNTSGGDGYRSVELTTTRPAVKVKTISGYYP